MTNYLDGPNPFNLPAPSPWWLQLLFDYDDKLRLFASKKDHAYRLCRLVARENRLGLQSLNVITHTHPDTTFMIQHGLVPVGTLLPWAIRSDKVIRDLMGRDTWRHGAKPGEADALVDRLEYREQQVAEQRERRAALEFDARNADAFRSMQFRNGSAVVVGARPDNRVSSPRSPSPMAKTLVSLTDL